MKKALLIFIFSVMLTNCAYAAETKLKSARYNKTAETLEISGSIDLLKAGQQISVTVSKLKDGKYDLENIVYIDQKEIDANKFTLSFPIILDNGYYVARIGGSEISEPKYLLIQHTDEEYKLTLGDVDEDGKITSADSALALQYVLSKTAVDISPVQAYIANVTHSGDIDSADSAWILSKVLNGSVIFPAEE